MSWDKPRPYFRKTAPVPCVEHYPKSLGIPRTFVRSRMCVHRIEEQKCRFDKLATSAAIGSRGSLLPNEGK